MNSGPLCCWKKRARAGRKKCVHMNKLLLLLLWVFATVLAIVKKGAKNANSAHACRAILDFVVQRNKIKYEGSALLSQF